MNYVRENQRLKQESMDEILTTLTADRLLPWPAWWNKHELKKPTTTKIIFLFNSRWGFVLETELSGKYTLPFEFSLYIFLYISSCCEDQFPAVFLLGKCSVIQLTPPTSGRISSLSGLMTWFLKSEFSSAYFKETLFVYVNLRVWFQNKHARIAENCKNLISAQPRISAHYQGPKI